MKNYLSHFTGLALGVSLLSAAAWIDRTHTWRRRLALLLDPKLEDPAEHENSWVALSSGMCRAYTIAKLHTIAGDFRTIADIELAEPAIQRNREVAAAWVSAAQHVEAIAWQLDQAQPATVPPKAADLLRHQGKAANA
jgi:hypothetical protein